MYRIWVGVYNLDPDPALDPGLGFFAGQSIGISIHVFMMLGNVVELSTQNRCLRR